jgi:Predicted nucleotide-binding protein containing TIR-like domain
MKPSVFIGSSAEALKVSYAIQEELSHDADVTIWSQDIFQLSRSAIESLSKAIHQFDFAIFVFAPDDKIILRGSQFSAVRDNVIYELGLFSGWIGYERTFIIKPHGTSKFRIPTDLLGITIAEYDATRGDNNIVAAVGSACNKIRRSMGTLGSFAVEDIIATHDSAMRGMQPGILNSEIAGYWLSRFTFKACRNSTLVDGVQYNLEYLLPRGQSALSGHNVICSTTNGKEYFHETRIIIIKDHILGRWFNINSQNFGTFQLQIYNNHLAMNGSHFGNANDNSVQSGEWLWIRVDVGNKEIQVLDRLKKLKLKKPDDMDSTFLNWMESDRVVPLSEITI